MGVNLDDVLGNKKQEVLFDKSKRTMNLLLIGVCIVVILIVIVAIAMFNHNFQIAQMNKAAMITRDAEKIRSVITKMYTQSKQEGNEELLIGINLQKVGPDKAVSLVSGGNQLDFKYGYYRLTKDEVNKIIADAGIASLEHPGEYVVNYSTGEVVSLEGVKWNGKTYYEVDDLSAISRKREDPNYPIPSDNTITINSPDDMKKIAEYPNAIFRLNKDIDMSAFNGGNGWTPIPSFKGKFDGRGYKIKNMKINNSSLAYAGLFGTIESGAYLKNLVLEDFLVAGGDYSGAIAGSCSGTITNCYVTGNVSSTGRYCGGLFGNFEGVAERLESEVSVAGSQFVGGFAGQVTGGTIIECGVKNVNVNGNLDSVGGFVGLVQSNRDLEISKVRSIATITGSERVGGLIGWVNAPNSIYVLDGNNSYAQGSITRGEKAVGGFIGELSIDGTSNMKISYNYTICKPSPSIGNEDKGGFIGRVSTQSNPSIVSCYWEKQRQEDYALSENGVGSTNNNSIKIDPLTPQAILLQKSFADWNPVLINWRFDNRNAPTLYWE